MRLASFILFYLIFISYTAAFAQTHAAAKDVNQYDGNGKAHGLWYTFTAANKGEPAEAVLGTYDHGNKTGVWYVSDGIGNMNSIETFKHNVRDGEAKYFENGQLACVGYYRGLNPKVAFDTVLIMDPITKDEKLVSVPTERGSVRHGRWRFYDGLSGRLIREEEYQIDELIYKVDFPISTADSSNIQKRYKLLPHKQNKLPATKFKQKEPTQTLIGG
ncbi:MAG: hypothetical protein QM530_05815 [Phycisphaerales bacterium]|nr:hypothetical protein [Phycisphaerales bacterium]